MPTTLPCSVNEANPWWIWSLVWSATIDCPNMKFTQLSHIPYIVKHFTYHSPCTYWGLIYVTILKKWFIISSSWNRHHPFYCSWVVVAWYPYCHIQMTIMVTLFCIRCFCHGKKFHIVLLFLERWNDVIRKEWDRVSRLILFDVLSFPTWCTITGDSPRCSRPARVCPIEGGIRTEESTLSLLKIIL